MLIYLARLPFSYEPEMDTKKAYNFLANNLRNEEIILMVRNTNYYLGKRPLPAVTLKDHLERDDSTGNYDTLSVTAKEVLNDLKRHYNSIWFYKAYANDELFGANKLITGWLEGNGYSVRQVEYFKRIELLNYKKNRM